MSKYYIFSDGRVSEAFELEVVLRKVTSGEVTAQDLISVDGGDWVAASKVQELFPARDGKFDEITPPTPPPPPSRSNQPSIPAALQVGWFYAKDQQTFGPLPDEAFKGLARAGVIMAGDLVWFTGQNKAIPAAQAPILADVFGNIERGKPAQSYDDECTEPKLGSGRTSRHEPTGISGVFQSYFIQVLKKSFQFSGRARRKEFWYFFLFISSARILVKICDLWLESGLVWPIFDLLTLIPIMSVSVRRLHDVGWSGTLGVVNIILGFMFGFVPAFLSSAGVRNKNFLDLTIILLLLAQAVVGLWALILWVKDSQPGKNRYGLNPKGKRRPAN